MRPTVDAWLSGAAMGDTAGDPADTPYWYGVHRTSRGKMAGFIVKNPDLVPSDVMIIRQTFGIQGARRDLDLMLAEVLNPAPPKMAPGALITLSDGDGIHLGVLIDTRGEEFALVVLTSNPYWNPLARPATPDDLAALRKSATKITYLAPIVRPKANVFHRHGEISQHRVDAMRTEFNWDVADRY